VTQRDVELVTTVYGVEFAAGAAEFDLARLIADPQWRREVEDSFSPNLAVRFVTPQEGGIQVMEQNEFEGLDGLAEGWRLWMEPWETFRIVPEDLVDAGEGRVLLLARATARMRGSGVEISQETAALHVVEQGRIAAIRFYLDQAQARRDAGLS
jgi:hypothetical protein